ncbi:hypothetical protein OIU34_07470 [Pararhizobium sp. BT-229]|uniref:hypothetical protein n=1 Tax=Pararhizobium sp. BT-229 TaxID=2986923 RepID=UPI0021F79429|nr:hypothetical protein [Pararhizobium sp. BT-229]MCV9961740.1 hypothetical protein [Pararhizobium sp. BT-229]
MEPNATTAQAYGCPLPPEKFDKMLEKVKKDIIDFEAQQLGKLKTELEAFEKKKKAVTDGYTQKYPALREKWRLQNSQIELLHRSLTCLFKDCSWKQHIADCVCPPLAEIAKQDSLIAKRRRCFLGPLEYERDRTKAAAEADKAYLDTLIANQALVESALSADDKLIAEIKQLLQGEDSAVAIYVFWFKLLPMHVQLAPKALVHCLDFAKGEAPDDLCPPKESEPQTPAGGAPVPVLHPVPWLVHPQSYPDEIDCAWTVYRVSKKAQGDAEAAYNKAPDDLASMTKTLGEWRKAFDGRVRDCLKKVDETMPCGCGDETTTDAPVEAASTADVGQDGGTSATPKTIIQEV